MVWLTHDRHLASSGATGEAEKEARPSRYFTCNTYLTSLASFGKNEINISLTRSFRRKETEITKHSYKTKYNVGNNIRVEAFKQY